MEPVGTDARTELPEGEARPAMEASAAGAATDQGMGDANRDGEADAAADREPMARTAYREQGLRALAYLDHLAGAVAAARATVQWNSDDAAAVEDAMGRLRANLSAAQEAIDIRADIVAAALVPAQPAEAPPAVDPAPERIPFTPHPEAHLVAATRALEAVRSNVDQALLGLQFAPRAADVMMGVLGNLDEAASRAGRSYLEYALAVDAEAHAR